MLIIRHYIHKEILQRLFWLTALLSLIYLSSRFIDLLAMASVGKISSVFIFKMLYLKFLYVLPKLLPVTIFFAVILAYVRLLHDREMVIMYASGMGHLHHLSIILQLMLPICVLIAGTSFFLSPWAANQFEQLKKQARRDADITVISAGQFKEFNHGNYVVYVGSLSADKKIMNDVFMQLKQDDKLSLLTADSAVFEEHEQSGELYIKFFNGAYYTSTPGRLDYKITAYKTYAILLENHSKNSEAIHKPKALSTSSLLSSDVLQHKVELQWRIASVLSCLLLPLLAVLLCQLPIAEKRYLLILLAILIYAIYSNLINVSRSLSEKGELPLFIGLWWVQGLLIICMIMLYYLPEIKYQFKKKNENT